MERLTERFKNGQAAVYGCGNNCKYDFKYCHNYLEDCPTINEIYEKLAVYEDLEEQGKLLKLPCAVGDKVYLPNKYVGKVIDFEIIEICIFKEEIMFIDDSENEYFIDDFGKTVFLTKEEAEAALKEQENRP